MYCNQYVYQYRCRILRKEALSRFVRPTLIVDIKTADTYGSMPIRHTARTLDNALPLVFTFGDIRVIPHNTVGGEVGPMRLKLILWYQTLRLPGQGRQYDALYTLMFGYNARFQSTLTLPFDIGGSLSAVVRDGRPLSSKAYSSKCPGVARVARG